MKSLKYYDKIYKDVEILCLQVDYDINVKKSCYLFSLSFSIFSSVFLWHLFRTEALKSEWFKISIDLIYCTYLLLSPIKVNPVNFIISRLSEILINHGVKNCCCAKIK